MLAVDRARSPRARRSARSGAPTWRPPLHSRDRGGRRVPGREHRVEQDHVAVGDVVRQLDVVLDRLERLLVAIEADEADPRPGISDSTPSSIPIPARRIGQTATFLPEIRRAVVRSSGVSISTSSSASVLRRLVREEQRQLVDELPEHLRRRGDVAQQAELVLDERVATSVTVPWKASVDDSTGPPGFPAEVGKAPAGIQRAALDERLASSRERRRGPRPRRALAR